MVARVRRAGARAGLGVHGESLVRDRGGAVPVIQFLAGKGAKLDVENKKKWTPLLAAEGVVYASSGIRRYPEAAALIRKLMRERGLPIPEFERNGGAAPIVKAITAPLAIRTNWDGVYTEAQAQRALHIFLKQVEQSVESAIAAGSGRNDRQVLAEKILEPDFQRFPELAEHCRQVSVLTQRFAIALELPPAQVETIRIAALVHDVGLRLIDYERLYGRPSLTAEELRGMAEHPIVGAAIVEPLLGAEIAQTVLRHHERVDGKGYPSRLSGNAIPLGARIMQICDAWVAMTGPRTYQPPMSFDEATRRIRAGAGTQFDATLVERFVGALAEIGA